MIELKKFARTESANLTNLGTVGQLVGKGGRIDLIMKNLTDATKRVAVVVKNAAGESGVIACSDQVSRGIRNKTISLSQVFGLEILENEKGQAFISMPSTATANFGVAFDEAKVTPVTSVLTEAQLSELVAF